MLYEQRIKSLLKQGKTSELLKLKKTKAAVVMADLLEHEMLDFDYSKHYDISYLNNMFDILTKFLEGDNNLQSLLYDKFTYIHNIIKNILHSKLQEWTVNSYKNYKDLKALINNMENAMLRIYYNNPTDYDPNKEAFIQYIIFDLKYIKFFEHACETFPHIVNCTNNEGIPLIEMVLDKYLNGLEKYLEMPNLGPLDDVIYYGKVIKIIMESKKVKIDDNTKKVLLEKIKSFAQSKNYDDNRHKEKLSFFINDITNTMLGISYPETDRYLDYKYEIHQTFKEAHELEASTIYINNQNQKGQPIKKTIYTFDGEDAKEIDDALSISLENGIYHLGVHIAYPLGYIPEDSILMDEAKRRTTSIYIGDGCIPLFPLNLSGDLMSLNEGKNTQCISYYFDIDELSGELLDFQIKKEVCNIKQNLTYERFDEILKHGCDDQELQESIILFNKISSILAQIYNEDTMYQYVHLNGKPPVYGSETVIANAMIYTNYQTAKLFNDRDLPFIYRCHVVNQDDLDRLTKLQNGLRAQRYTDKIVKNIDLIKNMFPRAFYTRNNKGHEGLGIDFYSHVTSPLRRLADNIADICIVKLILGEYTEDDIKRISDLIDETTEIINNKRNSINEYTLIGEKKLHLK